MTQLLLTATKENQLFQLVERMAYVSEQLKTFKTKVYRLEENGKLLSVDTKPQLSMYKRLLTKEGFNVTEVNEQSLDSLIDAYKEGLKVNIEEFYMNDFELEISAYIEDSAIETAATFFIKSEQFIFILEKMGFLVDLSDGIFDVKSETEFYDASEIYNFYSFTESQKSMILNYYLSYKMYI
jgi:hypothetical protein